MGFYVSGHPLEEYQDIWSRTITAKTADFYFDEEMGRAKVTDASKVTIGGMIAEKKIKYTKNDKIMAFLNVEDLVGNIEVIVFPRDYERAADKLVEDAKVFIEGRVSAEEDKDAKLICERIYGFDDIPKKLWIKYGTMEEYQSGEKKLYELLKTSEGIDQVVLYIESTKQMKKLPANQNVKADKQLLEQLEACFGKDNIKLV